MEWIRENWFFIVVFALCIGMHLFGHGMHGGHGGHGEKDEQGKGASGNKERKGGHGCH